MTPRREHDDAVAVRSELARELTGLARALTPDGSGLVVATLTELTVRRRSLRDEPSLSRWARDHLTRASLRTPPTDLVLVADDAGTPAEVDAARAVAVVHSLPPLPRAALVLATVDGLGAAQIAAALDIPLRKAQAALAEARTLVAERLPDPPEPPDERADDRCAAPGRPTPHPTTENARLSPMTENTPVSPSSDEGAVAPSPENESDDDLFAPPWRRGTR